MNNTDDEIRALLADEDAALLRWWSTFMAADPDPELILASGDQNVGNISRIFTEWYRRSRATLRTLVCAKLKYQLLTDHQKELGEIAVIAAVATILAEASTHMVQADPLATATILVVRRHIDDLCGDKPADANVN